MGGVETCGAITIAPYAGYRLPRNTDTITLRREEWHMPHTVEFGGSKLVPLRAGEKMAWKMVG